MGKKKKKNKTVQRNRVNRENTEVQENTEIQENTENQENIEVQGNNVEVENLTLRDKISFWVLMCLAGYGVFGILNFLVFILKNIK